MSDTELVTHLEQVWTSMADLGEQLSESEWKISTDVPGWSVQDNLTHITAIEWMLLGEPMPDVEVPDGLEHIKNDAGKNNEVFVESRRALTGAEALAEFREVTGRRLADLHAYAPDDFDNESWTPMGAGKVRDLLPFRAFDSWVHEQDMRRAVGKPGNVDSEVADVAVERMITTMPYVVGKKAGAPDGATVAFEVAGPPGRAFAVGVEGRAKVLDALPADSAARVVTDGMTFVRLATGRVDPDSALADGSVRCEGDEVLARKVVESMNFLF
ncbi:MAG TPA: maleylpyruvate isomerase family mycothiol-dependent enzyme [Acidimicrobiia bacterium]|nr:maleylpyruvate isomerase family mycothiol-dependent enzyme [Acidimicrobiia bacterium]